MGDLPVMRFGCSARLPVLSIKIDEIMGQRSDLKKKLLEKLSLYLSKINLAENHVDLSCEMDENGGRMFIKLAVSDKKELTGYENLHENVTFYRMKTTTVTSHPPKTLKYYDKSQHLSEKRKSNAFKSPSLQHKLYCERSQQNCPSKKKTRR